MASVPTILNASGVTRLTLKSTVSCVIGELLGHDGTDWVKADADARVAASFMAMQSVAAGEAVDVCAAGVLFDVDAPYTAGNSQYLSATAGAHTATIPAVSSTLTILQRIGQALDTERVAFDLNRRGPTTLRGTAAVDPASGTTDTVQNLAVTLTGVLATDYARLASAPTVVQGVIYNGSVVCTADTVTVGIANASAGTVNGASTTVEFVVERY